MQMGLFGNPADFILSDGHKFLGHIRYSKISKSCLFLIDPCHSLVQARWKLCGKTCCGLRPAVEYPEDFLTPKLRKLQDPPDPMVCTMVCTMKLGGQPCNVSLFWEYFDDCLSGKSRMMKDNEADQYGSFN